MAVVISSLISMSSRTGIERTTITDLLAQDLAHSAMELAPYLTEHSPRTYSDPNTGWQITFSEEIAETRRGTEHKIAVNIRNNEGVILAKAQRSRPYSSAD